MSTEGITVDITEDITNVTAAENVTTVNLTNNTTTVEVRGISIATADASGVGTSHSASYLTSATVQASFDELANSFTGGTDISFSAGVISSTAKFNYKVLGAEALEHIVLGSDSFTFAGSNGEITVATPANEDKLTIGLADKLQNAYTDQGGATSVPQISVDTKGRITSVTPVNIQISKSAVTSLVTSLGAASASTVANTGAIETNSGKIATNTAAIESTSAKVASISSQQVTNTADIESLSGKVAANTGEIVSNSIKILANTTAIQTNSGKIATNIAEIQSNSAALLGKLDTTGGTVSGSLTISGDLTVDGANTVLNTATLEVEDNRIILNQTNDVNGDPATVTNSIAGIEIFTGLNNGTPEYSKFLYKKNSTTWELDNLFKPYRIVDDSDNTGDGFLSASSGVLTWKALDISGIAANATAIDSVSASLAGTDQIVSGHTSSIESTSGLVAANIVDIQTNSGLIATNIASIQTNSGLIATNITAIESNSGKIATNISDIQTNSGLIATNITAIETNSGKIATNITAIETNSGLIATNIADIETNSGKIATNITAIETNSGLIATNIASIQTNSGKIATNITAIETNSGLIATNITAIETNSGKIATNTASIETNSGLIATNITAIDTVSGELVARTSGLTANQFYLGDNGTPVDFTASVSSRVNAGTMEANFARFLTNNNVTLTGDVNGTDFLDTYQGKRLIKLDVGQDTVTVPQPDSDDVGKSWILVNASQAKILLDADTQYVHGLDGSRQTAHQSDWEINMGGIAEIICVNSTASGGTSLSPNYVLYGTGIIKV